ncbi:MAG: DUF507 family protein [Candidatus Latescibacteria bacterium]|nr:DUF507 family protein [Candidatus Latescibacterota bacterium]
MRLSPNKIEFLAEKLLEMIERDSRLHIQTNSDLVYRAIADTIYDDMRTEDQIETEVEELLKQHLGEIRAMEMDYGALRAKMKREIARKQGFVL